LINIHQVFSYKKRSVMNTKFRTMCTLVLAVACSFATFAQSTEETLRRADTQFDLYAYNTALNSYNEVLKSDPNNAYALGRKADCYFQLNRPTEALPFYDRAMTLGRVDPEISFRYAQALMQTADYVGAKRWFNYYADANPATGQHYAAMCDYATGAAQRPGTFSAKGELINTPNSDYTPAFYGEWVVYSSARRDLTRKSPKADPGAGTNEIYITRRNARDGMLEKPNFYIADLQKSAFFNEGPVAFAGSGGKVAFCHNKFIDGTRQIAAKGIEMSLYLADLSADGKWSSPKPYPYNSSDYAIGFPWLSEDGNTVYFASNMPGGMGGWDIYSSTFNTQTSMWSTPRNLGATVNTSGNEISPFIDGNDLYFASDWHNGLGGLDVFRADFVNSYATNIVNLGPGVNSPRDDYGFIFDSKSNTGYFTSNRSDSKGNEDIYQIGRAREEFSITVRDQYQQLVPNAEVDFTACGASVMRTDDQGRYEFATGKGLANCTVVVRKQGYPSSTIQISSAGEHDIAVTLGTNSAGITPVTSSSTAITEALGSVVEYDTKDPIYGAKVSALPWPSGPAIEGYTNYSGQYTLNLEPEKAYTLNVVREGYKDLSTNIFSGKGGGQSTINQVVLQKGKSTEMVSMDANPKERPGSIQVVDYQRPQEANSNKNGYQPPMFTPGDLVRPDPNAQAGTGGYIPPALPDMTSMPTGTTMQPRNPQLISGYSIQLAATPLGAKEPDMKKFEPLSEYGKIYTSQEGKLSKVRLGVFTSRQDAVDALKKAKSIKKDAFIVDERGVDASLAVNPLGTDGVDDGISLVVDKKSSGKDIAPPPVVPALPTTQFAVQIKTLDASEPIIMNAYGDLAKYGNLYARPDNGVTRIRVGVWSVQADAELAQALIMADGYKDAVVIVEKSGSELPAADKPRVTPISSPTPKPAPAPPTGSGSVPKSAPSSAASAPSFTPVGGQGALPDLMSPVAHSTDSKKPQATMVPVGSEPNTVYMVRICSLTGDASKFESKKAEKAGGKLDARQSESGAIIMLLTNLADQQSATIARDRLIASGFKDAFVVKEVNNDGILRKVAE
jgi:tetratricopeptide (TPR) repeat protein